MFQRNCQENSKNYQTDEFIGILNFIIMFFSVPSHFLFLSGSFSVVYIFIYASSTDKHAYKFNENIIH